MSPEWVSLGNRQKKESFDDLERNPQSMWTVQSRGSPEYLVLYRWVAFQ